MTNQTQIPPSDAERLSASLSSKESKIYAATKLAKWFSIHLTIKIFGVTVIDWKYPPLNDETSEF